MIGKTISHYKIIEKLGEGGMGVVYKVQDTKLDRLLALKFLPPHLTVKDTDKARFIQEAKTASAINHPNVCIIHDIQEHEDQQFIVMEYVEGNTLRDAVGATGSVAQKIKNVHKIKDIIEYAIQIASALEAAHDKGVVHRDKITAKTGLPCVRCDYIHPGSGNYQYIYIQPLFCTTRSAKDNGPIWSVWHSV